MNIYQKAIKVRKVCEIITEDDVKSCDSCIYFSKCVNSKILIYDPFWEELKRIAKAIKEEKWNVK